MYIETQDLLNLIDDRIRKIISKEKFDYTYSAFVTKGGEHNDICEVRLAGYSDLNFNFLNKSKEILLVGDTVHILTKGKDLNTGIISRKM